MVKQCKGRIGGWFILAFLCAMVIPLFARAYPSAQQGAKYATHQQKLHLEQRYQHHNNHISLRLLDTAFQLLDTFSQQAKDTPAFYFQNKEQALDTLIAWLLQKKPAMSLGYLTKSEFVSQWRSHDTATLNQIIEGAWLTYQFKFKKSVLKTQLKMKQSKVNFKMAEVVPKPKITVSAAGDGITKYDYKVKYKKLTYILSFQLWWINGQGFWVNEVAWSMGV
ncbi:MAG: hypothetical protein FJ333_00125 [Sphingomonadales bacterium]|nr:hypothetical protein [Sphingomonadales bacterium]